MLVNVTKRMPAMPDRRRKRFGTEGRACTLEARLALQSLQHPNMILGLEGRDGDKKISLEFHAHFAF